MVLTLRPHSRSAPPASPQPFAEIFPIAVDHLPALRTYHVAFEDETHVQIRRRIGKRLARALTVLLGSRWLWIDNRLVTDAAPDSVHLMLALDHARAELGHYASSVLALEEDYRGQIDARTTAEWVVRGPLTDLTDTIHAALDSVGIHLPCVMVEREFWARPWVVGDQPAVSLSVISRLLYEDTPTALAAAHGSSDGLIGLPVILRIDGRQGYIERVLGHLGEHRPRLLTAQTPPALQEYIADAPDSTLVVRVNFDDGEALTLPADALWLEVRPESASVFGFTRLQVEHALQTSPAQCAALVRIVADVLKQVRLIGNAYSIQNAREYFSDEQPAVAVAFGSGGPRPFDFTRTPSDVATFGMAAPRAEAASTIRAALLNALEDDTAAEDVSLFAEALRRQIVKDFGYGLEIAHEARLRVPAPENVSNAARVLAKHKTDVLIAVLPDEAFKHAIDGEIPARALEIQALARDLPCCVLPASIVHQPEAMHAVIVGLLARVGHLPYVLADPIPYADRVVGLSLFRVTQRGKLHLAGIARLFRADGVPLGTFAAAIPAADEYSVLTKLIPQLLPAMLLQGKRTLIHHDGILSTRVADALRNHAVSIRAHFLPVEIVRDSAPRLYALVNGAIYTPEWGVTLFLGDHDALLCTECAQETSPMPLHLKTDEMLPIEQAVDSVLTFGYLCYGALRPPALPATLHHVDALKTAIERGLLKLDDGGEALPISFTSLI